MVTFSEAKNSRLKRVAGTCNSTAQFKDYLNEATRMLMQRGSWWNTIRRVNFCSYNNCLVFPRQVGTLLALSSCGGSIPPKNNWYAFDAVLPDDVNYWQTNGSNWGGWGWGWGGGIAAFAAADGGTVSVFNQIPCLNDRYVRFYPVQPGDVGKTITLFGIDGNGLVIRSLRSDGTYQDGIVLSLALPYVQTPMLVRQVDRVIKDPTDGPLYGYQFDGQNLWNLAVYEASETLPEYRTNRVVTGGCGHNNVNRNCGCGPRPFMALVKLQFIPVEHDDDLVQIDNLDALALAIQSIKVSDSYESDGAEKLMARAVHELNLELRNRLPIDQTVTRVHYQGSAELWKQAIGYQT